MLVLFLISFFLFFFRKYNNNIIIIIGYTKAAQVARVCLSFVVVVMFSVSLQTLGRQHNSERTLKIVFTIYFLFLFARNYNITCRHNNDPVMNMRFGRRYILLSIIPWRVYIGNIKYLFYYFSLSNRFFHRVSARPNTIPQKYEKKFEYTNRKRAGLRRFSPTN